MENSKLKYILPLLAILLSLTVMQIFCNGADNSLLYYFEPQTNTIDYEFIKQKENNPVNYYNIAPKIPLSELSGDTKIAIIKEPAKTSNTSYNKPCKNTKQRSGIFKRR